jgi:DNA (cytosine-5)-methyltransferase 1
MIPIVDIFAGPGGLGEGFSSWRDARGRQRFKLAVSIEKDTNAHATLRLRAFRRCFCEEAPPEYDSLLRGENTWEQLKAAFPAEAEKAEHEAQRIELGPANVDCVRSLIKRVLPADSRWVLIGGPPCQAYSIVGRSRNKGIANYSPELDQRQTLYIEYLQILADHAPPVFVMENVKGLLSARLNRQGLFDSIRRDLRDPAAALRRENRSAESSRPKYLIRALVPPLDANGDEPEAYVVRAERFGVPQRRHRVILLGVREDLNSSTDPAIDPATLPMNVGHALRGLPRVRSGLSKEPDSGEAWIQHLRASRYKPWFRDTDPEVRRQIVDTLDSLTVPLAARGSDYGLTRSGSVVLNHSTRGHMGEDLERYLFASAFAAVSGSSPVLREFPEALLPNHENVGKALGNGLFADRFRVQLANQPATTITSHISKDGHYYIHHDPTQCRSLTVREAARLQTFPDDYFFCGPRTSQYQQVGNAVPPVLAEQIARTVAELLRL